MTTEKKHISLDLVDPLNLLGQNDRNLSLIEQHYGIRAVVRGNDLWLSGSADAIAKAGSTLAQLVAKAKKGDRIEDNDLTYLLARGSTPSNSDKLLKTYRGSIKARSPGQIDYFSAIEKNDIVFAIGPAGTGKTYLAVASAVAALRQKQVTRIVLARPAVEAGESLGFLPGALEDKVDPYLRPLYDALQDLLEPERLRRFQEMKIIEIVPLAYMRGRTLNEAFIILDEAQNTTPQQMKMFLTRLGRNSKAVITGDITQTDLPKDQPSGLIEIQHILTNIKGLRFIYLTEKDVVRNPLVQLIIQAYERQDNIDLATTPSPAIE